MTQPDLFAERPTVKSPLCSYEKHCGSRAELGEPMPSRTGPCINTDVRCLACPAFGVISERTDI